MNEDNNVKMPASLTEALALLNSSTLPKRSPYRPGFRNLASYVASTEAVTAEESESSQANDSALRKAPPVEVVQPPVATVSNIHLLNATRAWRPQASGHSIQEGKLAALARDDSKLEDSPKPVPLSREAAAVGARVQSVTLYTLDLENGSSLELFARAEGDSVYVWAPAGALSSAPLQFPLAIRFGDMHVDLIEVFSDEHIFRLRDVTVRTLSALIAKVGRDSGN